MKKVTLEREATIIRLPKVLKDKLVEQAESLGISFNALVIILLNQSLQK